MRATVPDNKVGEHEIEHFTVGKPSADLYNCNQTLPGRELTAGTYTRLVRYDRHGDYDSGKGQYVLVMSDTPAEIADHVEPVRKAHGHVLINGLGLGCVLQGCMANPEVDSVTVVDISEDVIALSGEYFKGLYGDRLNIVHASAFDYKPPKGIRYGMVWHDIWDYISDENLSDMHRLHRKYGRLCDWQGSWVRKHCESLRNKEKRRQKAIDAMLGGSVDDIAGDIDKMFVTVDGILL